MNRNQRRLAHDLKRAGHRLGRVASGNDLAAQNDEPEPQHLAGTASDEDRRLAAMFGGELEGEGPRDEPGAYPDGVYSLERAINQRRGHL